MTQNNNENGDHLDTTSSLKEKLVQAQGQGDQLDVATKLLDHPDYIELQKKLSEMEGKANQNWDKLLRVQAETDNQLRRAKKDVADAHDYALKKFVHELLPVIDNLERALAVSSPQAVDVLEGVQLTAKMFMSVLEKFGVSAVDPLRQAFNPELHQAVSTQEDLTVAPGTVLSVLQKGYVLHSRLIRPAFVIVSKNS